jgi:hypothetical protein
MKTVTINVTEKHIAEGKPGTADSCAVTLAIEEAISSEAVFTYGNHVEIGDNAMDLSCGFYRVSKTVERFINAFDNKDPVRPFSFILSETNIMEDEDDEDGWDDDESDLDDDEDDWDDEDNDEPLD